MKHFHCQAAMMPQRRRRRLCAAAGVAALVVMVPPSASGFHALSDWRSQQGNAHTRRPLLQLHAILGRRDVLEQSAAMVAAGGTAAILDPTIITAAVVDAPKTATDVDAARRSYVQRFPTLFDPLYGKSSRRTITTRLSEENMWALEQSLVLGPLETPLRCVVVRLSDDTLWVHAPLAPTEEFFEMVESCSSGSGSGGSSVVAHVVCPTYALEHKVFVRDALKRWPDAQLWTSPGQFSFPFRSASDDVVWGRSSVAGTLRTSDSDDAYEQPPWTDEIQYETLAAGTFDIGGVATTLYETAFFHRRSKSLIVTDSVARVSLDPPPLNSPDKLLLVSKRSTSDPMPDDTAEARKIGWEKTALLVSYFFPEHEEPDPNKLGVVTWTDGWHDNFQALAGRLIVPPVVRTLLYAQDPKRVKSWVDRVANRWNFESIIPAHWEAPIVAGPEDFKKAFRFLEDDSIDALPENDLKRGLKPIADIALKTLGRKD